MASLVRARSYVSSLNCKISISVAESSPASRDVTALRQFPASNEVGNVLPLLYSFHDMTEVDTKFADLSQDHRLL